MLQETLKLCCTGSLAVCVGWLQRRGGAEALAVLGSQLLLYVCVCAERCCGMFFFSSFFFSSSLLAETVTNESQRPARVIGRTVVNGCPQ